MISRKPLRVVVFVILLLTLNLTGYADTIKLASWNIRIFSDGGRDDTELNQILK